MSLSTAVVMQHLMDYVFKRSATPTVTLSDTACSSTVPMTARSPTPGQRRILRTKDGHELFLAESDLQYLTTVKHMINDLGITDDGNLGVIDIPISLTDDHLQKILEWCRQKSNPCDKPNDVIIDLIFKNDSAPQLMKIIHACLYLDMTDLKNGLSKKVAGMLKGKSTREMRQILEVEGEEMATKEELEEIGKTRDLLKIEKPEPDFIMIRGRKFYDPRSPR